MLSPCVWASWKAHAEPFLILNTLPCGQCISVLRMQHIFPGGAVSRLASPVPQVSGWTALLWGPLKWPLHSWATGLNKHCSKCSSTNSLLLLHDEERSLHQNVHQCTVYFIGKEFMDWKWSADYVLSNTGLYPPVPTVIQVSHSQRQNPRCDRLGTGKPCHDGSYSGSQPCSGSQPWMCIRIPRETFKRWTPPPHIFIWLGWRVTWAFGFLEVLQVTLMCPA